VPLYDPSLPIRQARAAYFAASGFSADGGYGDKWVKLKIGRFALGFPNTAARVRAVKLHDIHHVLTEYSTTWIGEAEIGAWEIASGCGRHYPAWLLNFAALAIGLVLSSRRVFAAFVRGRRSRNLYPGEFHEHLLDRTVGELRSELVIPFGTTTSSTRDWIAFTVWSAASVIVSVLPYLIILAAIILVRT